MIQSTPWPRGESDTVAWSAYIFAAEALQGGEGKGDIDHVYSGIAVKARQPSGIIRGSQGAAIIDGWTDAWEEKEEVISSLNFSEGKFRAEACLIFWC